jgi:hypothetical protein
MHVTQTNGTSAACSNAVRLWPVARRSFWLLRIAEIFCETIRASDHSTLLEQAIAAIVARAAGEQARQQRSTDQ